MIKFIFNISLIIGDENKNEVKSSFFKNIFSPFSKMFAWVGNIIKFLKADIDINYWYGYETGEDAYAILISKDYGTGIYYNYNKPSEYFFKTFTLEGNPICCFNIPLNSKMGEVGVMHGQSVVPIETLNSTSDAETFITDIAAEKGYDPFVPLRVDFDDNGVGYVWRGRYSHFKPIIEYFENRKEEFKLEEDAINDWLNNYLEEEDDSPFMNKIVQQQLQEKQQPTKRKYVKKVKS